MARSRPSRTAQRSHLALLRTLTEAAGVSGDEGEVRRLVRERVAPVADDVQVDSLGNLLAVREGRGARRVRVMLSRTASSIAAMISGVAAFSSSRLNSSTTLSVSAGATVGRGAPSWR